MEKASPRWAFDSKGGEGWRWSFVDPTTGREQASDRAFPTLVDCIDDAERYGFVRDPSIRPRPK